MQRCYKCSGAYLEPHAPGFQDVCEECGSYIHCCFNCRFHDEYAHNHCAEPQADYVSDPNGMNRCEYFIFKDHGGPGPAADLGDSGARRRSPDWRNLRKGAGKSGSAPAGDPNRAQAARQKLEELFRKED